MIKNVKDSIIAIIHDIEDPPGYCWMLKSLYEFQKRNLMLNHMFFNLENGWRSVNDFIKDVKDVVTQLTSAREVTPKEKIVQIMLGALPDSYESKVFRDEYNIFLLIWTRGSTRTTISILAKKPLCRPHEIQQDILQSNWWSHEVEYTTNLWICTSTRI